MLYLWDVNGCAVAQVDTAGPGQGGGPGDTQILCVAQSQLHEWDRQNVIITGGGDGVVRMWSLDYVEVAVDGGAAVTDSKAGAGTGLQPESSITKLAQAMSASLSGDCLTSLRSAVARRQSGSVEEGSSDTEDCSELEPDPGSVLDPNMLADQVDSSVTPASPELGVTEEENFVLVHSPQSVEGPGPAMRPGDGYTWSRQLVFRAKLTMHTAFERADNCEPGAVTALAVSKDQLRLLVGDERGRVFSWAVGSKPGRGPVDHWVRDQTADCCTDCTVRFTIYERRHHCRNCGRLYCSACSRYQAEIPRLKITQQVGLTDLATDRPTLVVLQVRVCRQCYNKLQEG